MSSAISENLQITVMESADKKIISLSVNDYYSSGGAIAIYLQLTPKQARILSDLLLEKVPKNV